MFQIMAYYGLCYIVNFILSYDFFLRIFNYVAFIEDLLSTGLSNIQVNRVNYNILTSRLNFDIELPLINFSIGE